MFYRFDKVPLVTPNGDVLVKELNFEVNMLISFQKYFCFQKQYLKVRFSDKLPDMKKEFFETLKMYFQKPKSL
jgi:hypothetical protein